MAFEPVPITVDTKTVALAGTPEAITDREINCNSVFLKPLSSNTNDVFIVDGSTPTKKFTIPTAGLTLPISNPALINIDVAVNGEGLDWVAV